MDFPAPRQKRLPRSSVSKRGCRAPKRSRKLAEPGENSIFEALLTRFELELAYARVSTESGEQLDALKSQVHALERLEPAVDHLFREVQTGLDVDREKYSQLKRLIEERRVKRLRVTHASRLGRDLPEATAFIKLCDDNGCTVESLKEGRLTLLDSASAVQTVLWAAFAHNESRELSNRVRRGYREGRLMGKPMRAAPWGYILSRDKMRLEPDPVEFRKAQAFIAQLKESGWRVMPTWRANPDVPFKSIRGVTTWLDNPTLRGGLMYRVPTELPDGRIQVDELLLWDRHPRLLSDEDYATCQLKREQNRKIFGANHQRRRRPLTGLLRCTECLCKHKYIGGRTIASLKCSGDGCSQVYRGVREEDVIDWMLPRIKEQAALKLAQSVAWEAPPEVDALKAEIAKLEALDDPDLETAIEKKRKRLESMEVAPVADTKLLEALSTDAFWNQLTEDLLIELLQRIVAEVHITKQVPTRLVLKL